MSNFFNNIFEIADSSDSLDRFLNINMQAINDFYNSKYSHIVTCKDLIERFILLRNKQIEQLNYNRSYNKSFILMLLDYCERFNFIAATPRICSILSKNNIITNNRQQAALLFLYPKPKTNSELVDKFDTICIKLQLARRAEEDDESKVLATFLNYFGIIVRDTNIFYAEQVKSKLLEAIENDTYPFLNHSYINEILQLDLANSDEAYKHIQYNIDKILNKEDFVSIEIKVPENGILIEEDTEYARELSKTPAAFDSIRRISVRKFISFGKIKQNQLLNQLNRGVEIISNDDLMYAYLYSVGNMHKAKLQSAFESLSDTFELKINIIDWGCGQGIASMIFLEKYEHVGIDSITLIEPSEFAIKRASLHLKTYNPIIPIKTICKKLDELTVEDFQHGISDSTIHLFSNILDIDSYSQKYLIEVIEKTQSNMNYFVCISPHIDEIKTERLESFRRYFENKYDSFELLLNVQNSKSPIDAYWNCNNNYRNDNCLDHPHNGCNNQWTRVLKVFKVNLR